MKNENRVKEILDELKSLAESDFELHRISVLEKDLTEPPKVEQIDETHQKFNGLIYRIDKTNHYRTQAQIHRDIWEYYFGKIPENHLIHHRDFNPENNSIENLIPLTIPEHREVHNIEAPKQKVSCVICGKEFETYNGAKYCSRPCREIAESEEKTCPYCGKKFLNNQRGQKYCSRRCGQKARNQKRKENRDSQTFICRFCNREYKGIESPLNGFCSKICQSRFRYQSIKEIRTCPVCGKEFEVPKHNPAKTCSNSCGNHLRWENRRKRAADSIAIESTEQR